MKMLGKIALIAFTVTLFCLCTGQPALSQQVDDLKPIYVCQVTEEGSVAIGADGIRVCFVIPPQFQMAAAKFMATQTESKTTTEKVTETVIEKVADKVTSKDQDGKEIVTEVLHEVPREVEREVQKTSQVPKYANLFDLIVRHNIASLVIPILEQFPPPEVEQLKAAVDSYKTKIDAAKAAILAGSTLR